MDELYTANVRVQDLPRETDNILNMLATIHGKMKWEIVRAALTEYANNHKQEISVRIGV